VPRNSEVIRQWTILREIERARGAGVTIDQLSALCSVTTRTIRRDLQALEEAGFPIYDDRSHDDGRTRWTINGTAFKGLAAGLTLAELCALYFSRTVLESLSGTPFRDELEQAFDKLGATLPVHMRQFLDQLPAVIASKPDPHRRRGLAKDSRERLVVGRALEATLHHRQASLTYHSRSSERTKTYLVHPHRMAFAQGGLYLQAYVPEYGEIRTFAVERIRDISLLEERFTPIDDSTGDAFPHSLGVHSGPPERIEVRFDAAVADFVQSRDWHPSQEWQASPDNGGTLTLNVCVDQTLKAWVLSFGPGARVVAPARLATEIAGLLAAAAQNYREPRTSTDDPNTRL
jgi:predicted DNA-binding transcriptional regulator YafY